MKRFTRILIAGLALLMAQVAIQAQNTGSIGGTVTDPNGALMPGASVKIKGAAGQEFSAVTNDDGVYRVNAVQNGLYVVTVTVRGFKTSTVTNVKVDIGTPATVDVKLEIGDVGETVQISSGGEVLQTQTATVGSTIQGRQITEAPIASRDALDLVGMLPGTSTVGRPRTATINGLPKGALTITLDGVDVQTNDSRTSDGYFTYVRPRVDAIEEVTVSTANPGAESSGDGAVQIKFVTRRGNNYWRGGTFLQHRNEGLNANYWYLNRNPTALTEDGKAKRQKIRLFQYGAHFSGPIPFLKFGEDTDGWLDSGKNKRFFFVNYEEFRLPSSIVRAPRKVATPDLQNGIYKYRVSSAGFTTLPNTPTTTCVPFAGTAGQMECSVNIYAVATANSQVNTPDPTVANLFGKIRSSLSGINLATIPGNPNLLDYNLTATGNDLRKFFTGRFDFNLTKKHALEVVLNRQDFSGFPDLLNGYDPTFPGFPAYSQGSKRNSWTAAVRSTLTKSIVNEARYAVQEGGPTVFRGEAGPDLFSEYMGGYSIGIGAAVGGTAITTPQIFNSNSIGKNPVYDFSDSVTWVKGNHSINFGGQWKRIISEGNTTSRFVGSVGFGVDSTETVPFGMFSFCNAAAFATNPNCRLPGASATQQGEARTLWAVMTGRVLSYTDTAYLDTATGKYATGIPRVRRAEQRSYGLFVQDNWRIRPNFSINYGVRWQPQTGHTAQTIGNYTELESFDQIYGVSGLGNTFKPGTLTGSVPKVVAIPVGESSYPTDWNNFAPTLGVVWSPNFGEKGVLRRIFGKSGQSVIRGGYSVSYVREGTSLLESINGANPGGTRALNRGTGTAGSLTLGTFFRTPGNPNLKPFDPTNILGNSPAFPITLTTSDAANAFHPDIKTGQVVSYSFGYQRELDSNTVIEMRYVGNRGLDLQRQYNLNEFNTIENGFTEEFKLAQANYYANVQAGFANLGFAYRGPNTNTSPLPIMLSYFTNFGGAAAAQAASLVAANYTAANFAQTTLISALSRNNPSVGTFSGSTFESSLARRANAAANGRPINFFYVSPTVGASWIVDNSQQTWYNSAVFEVRRRLSAGLRMNASYVFSKAQSNSFTTDSSGGGGVPPTSRPEGFALAKNVQISDVRHQFKVDATYDLPFGRGRAFLSGANAFVEALLGGWSLSPTLRWQSGSPIAIGNVQLVGMTRDELQKAVKVRKESSLVYWLPDDIILNSQKAFNVDINNIANNGYGTTFGAGGPQGRFIAPAGYGNCIQSYGGQCGFQNLVIYGPQFIKLDASLSKRFSLGERRNVEIRFTSLDVLNHPNFRVGGWAGDTAGAGCCTSTFGQLGTGAAYQDTSTTNDPGGRIIDAMIRINW